MTITGQFADRPTGALQAFKMLIAGKAADARSGEVFESMNPYSGVRGG
jgi:hypothetical protein